MAEGEGDESTQLANDGVLPANFAEVVASLPRGPHCSMFPSLRHYRGFWLPEYTLLSLPEIYARFDLSPTGILVASFPKCGTTWLKSLCYAAARRSLHSPLDAAAGQGHPLLRRNSHDCIRSIDTLRFLQGDDGDGGAPPRFLGTHLPYSLLPPRATADASGCRIVYITRDPKDALVSLWHFNSGVVMAGAADDDANKRTAAHQHLLPDALARRGRLGLLVPPHVAPPDATPSSLLPPPPRSTASLCFHPPTI